jgi:Mg-chelatase subunit ChlD
MPHPTHRRPGAAPTVTADPAWQVWSHAWTRHLPRLTDRTDLTAVVAPSAGSGAPACFYPDRNRIEIDAAYIGHPAVADPNRAGHKHLVPTAYGLLVHEAAHATHSRWRTPTGTPPVVAAAADLLEESRAEARQRQRRRTDRRWLHHTVTTLLSPDDAPVDDAWHAGQLAGLLLARVDARIITSRETRTARTAVTAVLGRTRLRQLRDVWRQAQHTDDTDADAMTALAWQWCRILGIDPDQTPDIPIPDQGRFPGRLAAAITDYLAAEAGLTPAAYTAGHILTAHAAPASWTHRNPTPEEQRAARTLAARLAHARSHHPEPGRRPTALPPGRLRTRHAITVAAQAAAGTVPTATPWQQRATLPPPKPELRLAVLVDTSGSMHPYMQPLSSASWILAHAAHRNHATVTTIAFAGRATLLLRPRRRPTSVLEMTTRGATTAFTDAVKLADQLLDLRSRHTLRMLAVVSDGDLPDTEPAQRLITTLHRSGCAVLWLRPADLPGHTFDDAATLAISDPLDAIGHISRAAITALENA